ncbi:MAG: anti-sigma regulatory factor [Elainellaceae cyanobacterium]
MKTELNVPSDIRFLKIVEEWLLGSLEAELGTSVDWPQQANRLRLVLSEVYSNVVRHAHHQQPNLPVLIRLELEGRDLRLEIWDYGRGYDLSTYLPPKPQDKQEHGYGWLILNRLMDNVEYRLQVNGRNCLSLAATLSEDDSERDQTDPDQTLLRHRSNHLNPDSQDDTPKA